MTTKSTWIGKKLENIFYSKEKLNRIEKLREVAFHEAGHVCMAYHVGFKVNHVSVDKVKIGFGNTDVHFGNDSMIANALNRLQDNPSLFNDLNINQKRKSKAVALKIIHSLLAGPIAEGRYIALRDNKKEAVATLEHSDYKYSVIVGNAINAIIKELRANTSYLTLSEEVDSVSSQVCIVHIWSAITKIANAILSSSNLKVDKAEIEYILEKEKFHEKTQKLISKEVKTNSKWI